jgi:pimeloyl-ACP methyl ester carboxylesterase
MIAKYIDTVIPYLNRNKVFQSEYVNQIEGIQFMELANCWVRYLVKGEGKHTIVLAPDSPVTIEAYDQVIDILSKKYRVLIFETPAFGFSIPKIQFDFSYNGWTETIADFLKKVNLGPYVLAIPCVAGLSAIGIANKYPEMVEGIVSTQTPCWKDERNWVRSWDMKGVMTVPFWAQIMGHYLKTKKVHLIHRLITNKNKKHLEELSKKTLKEGACNCLATACQYYLVKDKPELLTPIHQPAISIWGEADKSHIRSGTVKTSILDYLPNADIIYLKEAGHFLEVEEPELFTQIVMDFISNKIEKTE